jgi:hypothetical protein
MSDKNKQEALTKTCNFKVDWRENEKGSIYK